MKRDEILREVATAVALIEGVAGVLEVVNAIARFEPIAVRKISRTVGLPVPIVAAICAELRKRAVVAVERPVQLTPEGRAEFGFAGRAPVTDPEVGLSADLEEVTAELTKVADAAPRVRLEIDQSHCTVETKIRRVLLLHEAGALSGKRVLFLGDDDLMSIALHRVARH
jgi:predicted methyltransferase